MDPRTKVLAGVGGTLAVLLLVLFTIAFTNGGEDERPASAPAPAGSSGSASEGAAAGGAASSEGDELEQWAADNEDRFPAVGAGTDTFPALSAEQTADPETFLTAFYRQLLTVDYASASWEDLMAWVRLEVAPPKSDEDSAEDLTTWLLGSLMEPYKSTRSVVASEQEWATYANAGTVQAVDGVTVLPNQNWADKVAAGTADTTDPKTECFDVTVTLQRTTERQESRDAMTFVSCTGTAANRAGYGFGGAFNARDAR